MNEEILQGIRLGASALALMNAAGLMLSLGIQLGWFEIELLRDLGADQLRTITLLFLTFTALGAAFALHAWVRLRRMR